MTNICVGFFRHIDLSKNINKGLSILKPNPINNNIFVEVKRISLTGCSSAEPVYVSSFRSTKILKLTLFYKNTKIKLCKCILVLKNFVNLCQDYQKKCKRILGRDIVFKIF